VTKDNNKMSRKIVCIFLCTVFLGGCAITDDYYLDRFNRACLKMGYEADTPELRECILRLGAAVL